MTPDFLPPHPDFKFDVLGIGEILIGFHDADKPDAPENAVISGDILNTLIACNETELKTALLSAIGNDAWTNPIRATLEKNNIDPSFITQNNNSTNGLYWSTPGGPYRFKYQRSDSAFSKLKKPNNLDEIISSSRAIYATGITCAISKEMYETVSESFQLARQLGVKTAFDLNYRPNLWKDQATAKLQLEKIFPFVDLFLPSLEDLELLYDIETIEEAILFLRHFPCKEVYLKAGLEGVFKITKTSTVIFIFENNLMLPPDFIGAGDSVNAYLIQTALQDMPIC